MIEAMSTGTPIIAWRSGSVPEVIDEGVTGFIVDSIEAAVGAVGTVRRLNRLVVRQRFEARFTSTHMAKRYLEVYEQLLSARKPNRTRQNTARSDAHVV